MSWLEQIKWNDQGLIPVVTQEFDSNEVLTLAWMNKDSLALSVENNYMVYWSRSRKKLWRKGEQSGYQQIIKSICLDCDNDTLLIKVEQKNGISCHTGRHNCFHQQLKGRQWVKTNKILRDPKEIYK